jgi:DNA-binding LacI/PurR family transcriptional regulator
MPVTLKRLARELGLHHSTVAYALSGKGTVKEATRQRVRETAAQLGYVPNGLARRMRARRTNVIGLVVPDVLINYNDFIQQTFRIAHERGFDAQIALTEFAADLEDQAVRFLMESRVDGVILRSRFNRWDDVPAGHTLRQLHAQRVPTISYGVPIEGSSFPCLALPIHRQGEVLAQHLLQLGHKQLAWLMPVPGPLFKPQHRGRVEGTAAALRAAGMDPGALQVICLSPEEAEEVNGHDASHQDYLREALPRSGVRRGRQLMRKAMALSPRPTAVLCLHEATAIGAIVEAQAMGLKVPHDVAVAASARGAAADVAPMSLTTADVSPQQAARFALDLLLDTIRRHESSDGSIEKSAPRFDLDAVLVVGHSTQG